MRAIFFTILFIIICLPALLTAQNRSSETVKINGQLYYIHAIKADETLESIAKIYNITTIDVEENNPTVMATGKLKTGMRLRIPNLDEVTKDYPLSQWVFVYYQVTTQKKLKDIAKEYGANVKDIKNNNPDIDNKPAILSKVRIPLKKGSKEAQLALASKQTPPGKKTNPENPSLSFDWGNNAENPKDDKPVKKDEAKEAKERKPCKTENYDPRKKSFNVNLFLPLHLGEKTRKDFSHVSFLEGALLAIEQMKSEGFSATINIKDVCDKESLAIALKDESVAKSDLIIGPFAPYILKLVSEFSKEHKIPMVSPFDSKTEYLAKDNPYFFQVYPSEASMDKELFQKTVGAAEANVVLVHSTKPDSSMLRVYNEEMKKAFTTYTKYEHQMGSRPEKGRAALTSVLRRDMQNLVFVASNDEAFVSDLLDRIMILNTTQYPISLYGTMQWRRNFKMVNITNYYALNMHIVQPFYVNYADGDVKNFIRAYRQSYNNEPSPYAFQGYDVTYYFLSALKKYGANFVNCPLDLEVKLLQSIYKFKRIYGDDGGNVNIESFLLEYTPEMDVIKCQ